VLSRALQRGSVASDPWMLVLSHRRLVSRLCLLSLHITAHTTTNLKHTLEHPHSAALRTSCRTQNHISLHQTGPRSPRERHLHVAPYTSLFNMSTAARRRLMRDFKRMQTDPPAGVSASPIADNVMTWYRLHYKHRLRSRRKTNLQP
jgi:hypothetical protein